MGRDNQAKVRQLRRKTAKDARRAGYSRILIVTEGSKTEPLYLEEIRAAHQLHSANVEVQPAQMGTAPIQVVRYAQQLFEDGDMRKGIRPKSFDQVYAVFDRDDHDSYFSALNLAKALDGKLRNDEKQPITFKAIASIPSFELWLLLHYESVQAPIQRDEVMALETAYSRLRERNRWYVRHHPRPAAGSGRSWDSRVPTNKNGARRRHSASRQSTLLTRRSLPLD